MKAFLLSATLLISLAGAARQDEGPRLLDPKLVPAEGQSARDFVPKGWKVETVEGEVRGDLNGDGAADAVLRLVEDMPIEGSDGNYNTRYRALVILLARPGGGFTRATVATKLLQSDARPPHAPLHRGRGLRKPVVRSQKSVAGRLRSAEIDVKNRRARNYKCFSTDC